MVLEQARSLLLDETPLRTDCGRICGAACCASHPGEETGMQLFPGEERYYAGVPGWRIRETAGAPILFCPGRCQRENRPLSCRLFPLVPVLDGDQAHPRMDARAGSVCPLSSHGLQALSASFLDAAGEACRLLAADPAQRAFLAALTAEQAELDALRHRFLGKGTVRPRQETV